MGITGLNYSFAGLREERELAAAEKMTVGGAVWRKVEPDYEKRTVKPAPAGKSKKGY